MTALERPATRPQNPLFSSGPCAKRPGWSLNNLKNAMLGRSHRSAAGKARLKLAIDRTRAVLKLPDDYLVAVVPGSDTGAVEMALWSLLGPRGVDVLAWEAFGKDWVVDVVKQLKLGDVHVIEAPYGQLPDLARSISRAMSSLPGTEPRRACACRTQTGSRRTGRASPFVTRPQAFSRNASIRRSSM